MDYLDFELEIGYGDGREFPLRVLRSPAGEARETMRFPHDELALDNRLQAIEIELLRSGRSRRRLPSAHEHAAETFGGELFEALLTGAVRRRWDVSRREAATRDCGLRLKLRIDSPELAALPWEFLYDSDHGEYLSLSRTSPVVRYLELPHPVEPLQVNMPLRVLAMAAAPADLDILDVDQERQRIEAALSDLRDGAVDVHWLEGQGWRSLQRALRKGPWHVFHFIGHGGFDRTTDEGIIALVGRDGNSRRVSATQLGRLLADHPSLRLVVLNSCEAGRSGGRDIFSSTSSILVRRGIPAVLAMQYEITDRAAIEFSRAFYEAIGDQLAIDDAVTEARKAVSFSIQGTVEWATPVLHMHAPDGVLFDLRSSNTKVVDNAVTTGAAPAPPEAVPPAPDISANEATGPPPVLEDPAAYPRLAAPEQVTARATFELEIGLGDEPMENWDVGVMKTLDATPTLDIEVQVVAPDFDLPTGGRRFLHVRLDDPTAASVTVPMVAPDVDDVRRCPVRVEYVRRGMPVGQAWREVVVTPTDERIDTTVDTGAAPVTVTDPSGWADLTVFVSHGDHPDELIWSFFTKHDVAITEQTTRSLDAADAQAFAHEQVLRLSRSAGSDLELAELTGVSRIVADVMPPEFWPALAAVAAVTDDRPSLFLVTADPWIPWELASTEEEYLPPEVVDPDAPPFLGAQFRVARWLEQRDYRLTAKPAYPPADRHQIGTFCLVIGDYLAEQGQRPLRAAVEEGELLAYRYPHVWRSATSANLAEVLGNGIRERGEWVQVDALHLACHGRPVTDDAPDSGIVLSDDQRPLDPTTIRGSTLIREARPFVFFNASQVGQATTVPGGYGGMVEAFVREGATGVVAPMWEGDDELANRAALNFYDDTLEGGLPVAEAMRRFRAGFTPGASTRLAYVYYGHPGLQLSRASVSR